MKLSLHLGAHKTATSYLQKRLARNGKLLDRRGVLYIPLDEQRTNISDTALKLMPRRKFVTRYLNSRKARKYLDAKIAERAKRDDPPLNRILLSDENFTGSPHRMVETGRLYPEIGSKLAIVRKLLDDFEVEIFFSIRHQGSFASSIFAETLRHPSDDLFSEAAFRNAWLAGNQSWTDVVTEITRAFPDSPVRVWNYDDFELLENLLMNRMCGTPRNKKFPRKMGRIRETFSQRAIEEILRIQDQEGAVARRGKMRETRLKYPRGEEFPPYSLWTEEQFAAHGELFAQDLKAISGLGGKVRLLKPSYKRRKRAREMAKKSATISDTDIA